MTTEDYLSKIPAFASRPAAERTELAKHLELRSYRVEDRIFDQGDQDSRLFFLVSGKVAFQGQLSSGEWFSLEEIQEGSVFGEVACFSNGHRSARAEAVSDCVVLTASGDAVAAILRLEPKLAEELLRAMAYRLQRMSLQLKSSVPTVREVLKENQTPLDQFTDSLVMRLGQYPVVILQVLLVVGGFGLSLAGFSQPEPKNAWMDSNLWGLGLGGFGMLIAALVLASERRQREDAERRDEVWDQWRLRTDAILEDLVKQKHL